MKYAIITLGSGCMEGVLQPMYWMQTLVILDQLLVYLVLILAKGLWDNYT